MLIQIALTTYRLFGKSTIKGEVSLEPLKGSKFKHKNLLYHLIIN